MTMPPPPPGQGPIDPGGAFGRAPGFSGPPPMMMPPMFLPPPPRRGGFVSAIVGVLAALIFSASIGLNIWLLVEFFGGSDDSLHETKLLSGSSSDRVVCVQISGIIDDNSAERLEKILRAETEDSTIKALVLEIDSPGGGVTASDQMYDDILKFKEIKHIPVVVSMGSLAASGGYYISCAADQIVAQRSTITGSIGVLMPRYDLSALGDKYGVVDDSIHSTGATFKTAGSPLKPLTEPERAYFTALLDDMFKTFKSVVVTGRGKNLTQPIDQIAIGKAFTGDEAIKLGLVDKIGYANDAYGIAINLAKLSKPEIVRVEPTPSLFSALGGGEGKLSTLFKSQSQSGPSIQLDGNSLRSMLVSKPMYLWSAQ